MSKLLVLIYEELIAIRLLLKRTSMATSSVSSALPKLNVHELPRALQPNASQQQPTACDPE